MFGEIGFKVPGLNSNTQEIHNTLTLTGNVASSNNATGTLIVKGGIGASGAIYSANNTLDDGTGNVIIANTKVLAVDTIVGASTSLRLNPSASGQNIYVGHDLASTFVTVGAGSTASDFSVVNASSTLFHVQNTGTVTTKNNTLDNAGTATFTNPVTIATTSNANPALILNNNNISGTATGITFQLQASSQFSLQYDSINGINIFDNSNNSVWLYNHNVNKQVKSFNNTLDDGSGGCSFATSGSVAVNIGNGSSTLTVLGTTNINNTGTSNTNINTAGGTLTIGTSSTFSGNAGNVAILSGVGNGGNFTVLNNVTGTNSMTFGNDTGPTSFNTHGTININTSGSSGINIGTGGYGGTLSVGNSGMSAFNVIVSGIANGINITQGASAGNYGISLTPVSTSASYRTAIKFGAGSTDQWEIGTDSTATHTLDFYLYNSNQTKYGFKVTQVSTNLSFATQNNTLDDGAGNMTVTGSSNNTLMLRTTQGAASDYCCIQYFYNTNTVLGKIGWSASSTVLLGFFAQNANGDNILKQTNGATTDKSIKSYLNTLDDGSSGATFGNTGAVTINIGNNAGPSITNLDGTVNFLTTSRFPGIIPRDVFCYTFFGGL